MHDYLLPTWPKFTMHAPLGDALPFKP